MLEYWHTAQKLGEILDTSYRNIQNWAANNKIKQNSKGQYGLISAFKYQNAQLKQKFENHLSKLDISELKKQKLQIDIEKETAIARIKKLEADKLEGILVDAEEVGEAWKNYILRCRTKLLSLPSKLALELSGISNEAEIEQILQKTIDEALAELSSNHTANTDLSP